MTDYTELETSIDAKLKEMGLTLQYTNISPGDYKTASVWSVIVRKGDKHYQTEFTSGCGNRVFDIKLCSYYKNDAFKLGFRDGKRIPSFRKPSILVDNILCLATKPMPPKLVDVMCCLVRDAECAEGDFEDFCCELGYDDDSIKALETYNACRKTRKGLRSLGLKLDELSELFQDY